MNLLEEYNRRATASQTTGAGDMSRLELFAKSQRNVKLTAQLMLQTDTLTKKDIGKWRQAWQMAINVFTPNRVGLYDIYQDSLIDLHLEGCIGQREGMTLKEDFHLVGKDGKENEEATALLRKEWFNDFLKLALDSRYWGHSLIQMGDVINDGDGIRFDRVSLVPRKHVCPEHGVITAQQGDDWHNGISYREGDFAEWCVEVGKPNDLGLLLKCAPQCISKKNMLGFWDMFGEIFGAPMRIAKTSTTDVGERARLERALDSMGSAFWGLFPDGTDIEIKESAKGDAYNVYDKRIERANSELSKGILNQTMTIDNGSSHSQSETHLEVFENVVKEDKKMIYYIVNGRLLPLMRKHGFPVAGLTFKWDDAANFTADEQRKMEDMLLRYYDIDPQYFMDKYNVNIIGVKQDKAKIENFFG